MNRKYVFLIVLLIFAFIIISLVNKIITDNDVEEVSFNAAVLENNNNFLLVEPEEGSSELNSSNKIVVRVQGENNTLKDLSEFTEGSIVKITYDGMIMESYPAQINAYDVELIK